MSRRLIGTRPCLAALLLLAAGWVQSAVAAERLRIAVYESLDFPLSVFDKDWHLGGGLQKEFGDRMAQLLEANPVYQPYSRRRIENAVISGEVDLLCYTSPKWLERPSEVIWSIPTVPQIERIAMLTGKIMPENFPEQLLGKKLATQLGYRYPEIEQLVANGQIKRVDQANVPGMFRMVELGGADALVAAETEIEGFFKKNPEKRPLFQVSKSAFSNLSTQCALSFKSQWKIEQIDRAIRRMQDSGELEKMMRNYGASLQ